MFFNALNSQGFLINKQTTSGFPLPVGMFSTMLKTPCIVVQYLTFDAPVITQPSMYIQTNLVIIR